ncbi:hypothetical protein AB0I54_45565 [Streptomyces sp. NPDC050625]|uniref:hypothetical protein n=1 Tax=Streptomyces sp. NPDC050625 TaxID=3154629 RepID=UPI00342CD07F
MVADTPKAGVSARWFAADEVYCGRELRAQIRQLGLGYTVGLPATHPVTDGAGHRWQARQMLNKVRPGHWMRRSTGDGAKGRREYDWAWLDIRADDTPDGARQPNGMSVLVARRHRYTGEISCFRCWAPGDVALGALVEIICRRWKIEETFQLAKGLHRPGPGPGYLLELPDALVAVLPDRRRRPRTDPARHDARRHCQHKARPAGPPDLPGTCTPPAQPRSATTRPRPRTRPALDRLAPTPSSHRPSLPPATTPPSRPTMIGTTAAVTEALDEPADEMSRRKQ